MTESDDGSSAGPRRPVLRPGPAASNRSRSGRSNSTIGTTLPDLTVAYRHDGPGPGVAPQVLVVHALTGSADAAGDWWEPLIGPGRALDTDRFGVLSANLLGGRYGTTGPTSPDPRTGRPYGAAFPAISTRDQARAQWRLLDALGDRAARARRRRLARRAWSPSRSRSTRPDGGPDRSCRSRRRPRPGPMAVAWNHIQVELIDRLGLDGLALARELAMTTYRSEADFDERFGRDVEPDGRPSIVSYLDHQGRKLVDRFDPATYRDPGRRDGPPRHRRRRGAAWPAALARLAAAGTRLTGVGIEDDILYGPRQVRALVDAARGGRRRRDLPRDPLDQGPRRVPGRVGPADGDPARGARGSGRFRVPASGHDRVRSSGERKEPSAWTSQSSPGAT